jgi:hypothetical protein
MEESVSELTPFTTNPAFYLIERGKITVMFGLRRFLATKNGLQMHVKLHA